MLGRIIFNKGENYLRSAKSCRTRISNITPKKYRVKTSWPSWNFALLQSPPTSWLFLKTWNFKCHYLDKKIINKIKDTVSWLLCTSRCLWCLREKDIKRVYTSNHTRRYKKMYKGIGRMILVLKIHILMTVRRKEL